MNFTISILYKGVTHFKTLRESLKGKVERGQYLLIVELVVQMVSEPDTRWRASEDVGPRRELDCEIPHQLEKRTKHYL